MFGSVQIGWDGGTVEQKIRQMAGRGLQVATIHLSNRVRQAVSVPAPRRRSSTGRYVATSKASPGAPPRKLSGQLRRSIAWQMYKFNTVGRVGTNVVYGRPLETWMNHSYLFYSLKKAQGELTTIMQTTWNNSQGFTNG